MQYEVENSDYAVEFTAVNMDVAITGQAEIEMVIGDAARIDVGEALNYIKSGQAEIEAVVTEKTAAFNLNAINKTTAFNNNATSKTGDFDTNATSKTNTFNGNATDKTDAFNLNATNKTTDFNDNYTAKKALIDAEVGNAAASATAADNSAKEAKQWAIGDPSEPSGNSAKYWAEEAATTLANKQDKLTVGTGIDITSDVISVDSTVVTTNTDQDITGIKTFVGEKRIKFKQSASGNKLGFTLYDNNNKEAAAFEYKPNVINGYPLMYLGQYIGSSSVSYVSTPIYVGFRLYDWANTASYNLVAPLAKDAKSSFSLTGSYKTFYLPLGVTDGNTTVTTGSNGVLDISSLLSGGGGSYTAGTGIDITSNTISVDSTVASGAAAGATAVQPADLAATLAAIYPVGSIYIGTQSTCPMSTVISGSTWELVASNKALWTGNGTNANTTIAAGLPEISGDVALIHYGDGVHSGAFSVTKWSNVYNAGSGSWWQEAQAYFKASDSNSIYGNSSTVQPPAYVVNVWRRTA